MSDFSLQGGISVPETPLSIIEHLGLMSREQAEWAWYEIAGGVLSHYLVDQRARLDAMLSWFYRDLGFSPREQYFSLEAASLAHGLLYRQGNSTVLATVIMLLAKQLDLTLEPILLPGQTLLCWKQGKQKLLLDPLSGEFIDRKRVHALVRGELGNAAPMKVAYVKPVSVKALVSRMLQELKAGAIVAQRFDVALECCNMLIDWHPDDTLLIRERAFIAQQLGANRQAEADLRQFIELSPHDPVIELVKMQLKELSQHHETLH
ncbi:tetratricopeptide repeat protein [Shewanella sp. JM162201]|uniref:Tetratricopeptide repeat protein n=1 Tax=Shewanella jiangmenensis TaxID=2837387 RepID=A0ABS5V2I2_9GAMM|nr:tetratricopeptide repeat protein [Shewanella jiangmenensis]MBT1444657.1 tetratricopeptide repeat protein [Shewanella jiangmenensis]